MMHNPLNRPTQSGNVFTWQDLWSSDEVGEVFGASFKPIRDYLWLTRNTESPRQYHLWSLLSLASTIVSNNVWFNHGVAGRLKLNFGIVLIGRPALRKSSAISFMQRFASNLPINYGPTDTGGARHGVMAAMQTRWQEDLKDEEESPDELPTTLSELASSPLDSIVARLKRGRTRPASIYFTAKELGRILTAQTRELLDFFADGIDGEPIFYQTKSGNIRIPAPLINLLGATTPGSLAQILPRDAYDHGLLSRLIFVYGGRNERSVPIPPAPTPQEIEVQSRLLERLERVSKEADGQITFADEAVAEYELLYNYAVATTEFRLNAYASRRAVHLVKLASIICLLRAEAPFLVSKEDVGLAHLILILTESEMEGAYMAMSRSVESRAYVIIREVLESMGPDQGARGPIIGHLIRSGWNEQESITILDTLLRMNRIKGNDGRIQIADTIGYDKAFLYFSRLLREKRNAKR